ncbi:MAG: sensor domain-containing diguanylate cyclase [Lachnospiraceae bacterium]|nr:sensor domain-containing diguanylate cyclase [Lachnospiraceae bacterium]
MKENNAVTKRVWLTILSVLAFLIICYVVLEWDLGRKLASGKYTDFSEGWKTLQGEAVDVSKLSAGDYGGSVILVRNLPETETDLQDFCFVGNNVNVCVKVGDRVAYEFKSRANFTGWGCGYVFHSADLKESDAGKELRLELSSVFPHKSGGRISNMYICKTADYMRLLLEQEGFPATLAMIVIVFGVLICVIYLWIPSKMALPYDLRALGSAMLLLGLWSLEDTGILGVMSGNIYMIRTMDYTLLVIAVAPALMFVNSVTRHKRKLYNYIAMAIPIVSIGVMASLRYGYGIDMNRLNVIKYIAYFMCLLTAVAILFEDRLYYRKQGTVAANRRDNLFFLSGISIITICSVADLFIYIFRLQIFKNHGNFLRIGLGLFAISMLLQFLHWWSGERTAIERDRFINRLLQYAVSANDPETSIHAVLEYLGTELMADRAYIFEENKDHTFDNTYEWCREGVTPEIGNLQGLPYEGVVDVWYEQYRKDNQILIYDIESYRKVSENMYQVLKPQGIQTLVTGPMMANGSYIGFFGVDNPPKERMQEISEIIRLLGYFISQLVQQREFQKQLKLYSYYDSLTGAKNRRAYEEFEITEPEGPYGTILCDINGLKRVNDSSGHEAGDVLITDVSSSLMEAFGAENVYRLGGDEFVVYSPDPTEEIFLEKTAKVKDRLEQKNRSASIGAVYCSDGKTSYKIMTSAADSRMYEEKEKYYQGKRDRRGTLEHDGK